MIHAHPARRTVLMLKTISGAEISAGQEETDVTLPQLFEREETPLLRYAFALTGRRAIAEEIVQEAFLQLHARWKDVDRPTAWLYRCVRNRAFNYVRDHKKERLTADNQNDSSEEPAALSAEDQLKAFEAMGAIRQLLDGLAESDRHLVKLKYFEGLKYREIADQTGLSVSNVGYRLHHILKEMSDQLRVSGFGTES